MQLDNLDTIYLVQNTVGSSYYGYNYTNLV